MVEVKNFLWYILFNNMASPEFVSPISPEIEPHMTTIVLEMPEESAQYLMELYENGVLETIPAFKNLVSVKLLPLNEEETS